MSYNLLLDTNLDAVYNNSRSGNVTLKNNDNNIGKHWKLTNCYYCDGYLVSNDTIYSIEQEITLTNPTKLYFSMDYIAFNKDIKKIYIGILCGDTLETTIKKPKFNDRCRVSVVHDADVEKIKVKFIIESKTKDTKLYIDSPLLVDLNRLGKSFWPKWMLNKVLDYRHGYSYQNLYKECELTTSNSDFNSAYSDVMDADVGIIVTPREDKDWFDLNFDLTQDNYYLAKIDIVLVNKYGEIYLLYGQTTSVQGDDEQIYMIFKSDGNSPLKIKLKNNEYLKYQVNIKRVLIVDITNKGFEDADIFYLPFIQN